MSVTRASLNELQVTAQKALEGAGVAPGLDRDGARAVVWLESRGLGGLAMLLNDFPHIGQGPLNCKDASVLANGRSCLVVGPLAVDLAVARLDQPITVEDCRSPLAAVAYAAGLAQSGRWFSVSWPDGEALVTGRGVDLKCSDSSSDLCQLVIRTGTSAPPPPHEGGVSAENLEARHVQSVNDGLMLDSASRDRLRQAANRVLVPASERSRSGAGAEVDDNE